MSEELKNVCPICGEPTYLVYGKHPRKDGLCSFHSKQLFNKIIMQCPDCGKWIETDEVCECKKVQETNSENEDFSGKTIKAKKYTNLPYWGFEKCVLCGVESSGYAFCKACWNIYATDTLLEILNNFSSKGFLDKDYSEVSDIVPQTGYDNCILCNEESDGRPFCFDCWGEKFWKEKVDLLRNYTISCERKESAEKNSINKNECNSEISVNDKKDSIVSTSTNEIHIQRVTADEIVGKLSKTKCIICGTADPEDKESICENCDKEIENHMDSLDKNGTVRKFRDYYYNLKERILIINDLDEAKNQCRKLIAIAELNRLLHDDTSLTQRAYTDSINLLNRKKEPHVDNKYSEVIREKDQEKSKINTAQDGHNVDSDMEVRIDDVLYKNCILHCYGKSVSEIIEKRKKCDWFIPIANNKGIYIEYWGMDTPKYLEDRKEKEELYQKHNLPYISIEKDDPKQDSQTFTDNLLRDLRAKAIEYFGFMPEWKK